MNYPVWQLGYPGGMLVALVAVLHVFVSHFAVGGGAFLVITEHGARRRGDDSLLAYVRHHSKFFALVTLVFGAVSGVGIWFTIGLVSPEATSSLIHTFVWGWAIEWVFFFVEIAAALIYAYSWDKLDSKTHLVVGWIYFFAAFMSLLVINGILTYMLTPGRWLETRNFWDGFFNPTYLPSAAIRTAMAIALAGMFGLITAMREAQPLRACVVRRAGWWVATGLVLVPLCAIWYFRQFPDFSKNYLAGLLPVSTQVAVWGGYFAAAALVLAAVFALAKPRWMNPAVVAILLLCGLGVMGTGEYLREFSRKPYAINGYIYANDIRVSTVATATEHGAKMKWFNADSPHYGRDLFVAQCGSCHSVSGYRGITRFVRGWDQQFAAEILPRLHLTRGTMPKFAGNAADQKALGSYLSTLAPANIELTGPDARAGEQIFNVRCALCHTPPGGKRRPLDSFKGVDYETADGMIQALDSMTPDMPPFTGTDTERARLANWLRQQ